ncbi:uncharacterized protein LOC110853972 [Folsomia candida]|uniref:Uncharacterized protein n=1 Tax=Folsomia candida TaxID=158441 RepID=A0A226DZB5_FOLCA|nr:uncharacterized protein LOC110853972 [Folsomia candida]OXA50368.1 hypothetical protein Fcan01_15293 [Folsomia candida]
METYKMREFYGFIIIQAQSISSPLKILSLFNNQNFAMFRFVLVVLALLAVASAQLSYTSGVSGPNFHNAFASSASTGIRRYGSTAGLAYAAAPAYAAAIPAYY